MHDPLLKSVFADRGMIEILIRDHVPEWAGETDYSTLRQEPAELVSGKTLQRRHPDMIWEGQPPQPLPEDPAHPTIQTPGPLPHLGVPANHGDSMHNAFLKSVFADHRTAEFLVRHHAPEWASEVRRGVYVHAKSCGRYYQRVGATTRDLDRTALERLFRERGSEYVFDERQVFGTVTESLDWNRVEAIIGRCRRIPQREIALPKLSATDNLS